MAISGRPIRAFGEIPDVLRGTAGQSLPLRVFRAGSMIDLAVTPRDDKGAARIGIAPKRMVKQFGFASARPCGRGSRRRSAGGGAPRTRRAG